MLYRSKIETLDDLLAVMSAAQLTRTLQVAHHLGIFAALADGPQGLAQLAEATEAPADLLEPMLTACCALGLNSCVMVEYVKIVWAKCFFGPG